MPRRLKTKKEIIKELTECIDRLHWYKYFSNIYLYKVGPKIRNYTVPISKAYNKRYDELDRKFKEDKSLAKKLRNQYFAAVARNRKRSRGKSLAELITDGSGIELYNQRWCSRNGRELRLDFKMYRMSLDTEEKKYYTEGIMVHTPAMIGLRRVQGFTFNGEYDRFLYGSSRDVWSSNNKGILYKEAKYPNDVGVAEKAIKFRASIKDAIKAQYLDSAKGNVYNIKLKDVYLLNTTPRVNKKEYRKNHAK